MSVIRIHRKSENLEIFTKLLNSVAAKYDCRVKFNPGSRQVRFFGDDALKPHVISETLGLLGLE